MTKPTTMKFGDFLIEIGDGGAPETFGAPCGLTSKTFGGTADTVDTLVPDCDDPDAPAWKERAVQSLARDISGQGVLAAEFLQQWDDWFSSGLSRNCKITLPKPAPGFVWSGAYLLTSFSVTADLGDKVKVNISMTSDGQVTRAAAS